ncbi:receptor-like kinase TAK33-like protein [Hordeum vulgare]|nr:receptor-like kinase TAK33-like protein [Hordeum vulgare]
MSKLMITEFTNKHKIDAKDIREHLFKLYDRIDHLQAQIYDLQNQNCEVVVGTFIVVISVSVCLYRVVPDPIHLVRHAIIKRFFSEMANEKPIRFTPGQLQRLANIYSSRLGAVAVVTIIVVISFVLSLYRASRALRAGPRVQSLAATKHYAVVPDRVMRHATIEKFFSEMANEKPIRFTPAQLQGYTNNYSSRLGAGGFGTVYKGMLPNGLAVAVNVLHGDLNQRSEEQFMAEMGTIGRTHHINLVRLFGFCFDASVRALVYDFMQHGALDSYLFNGAADVGMAKVATITTSVAEVPPRGVPSEDHPL